MSEGRVVRLAVHIRFLILCTLLIWLTHYIALFSHEYAHSFTAWLLGCKGNPWALQYGRLTPANLILLQQIDENVDYPMIFAQGRGGAAALTAFAGAGIGNGVLYLFCRLLMRKESVRHKPNGFLFLFWLCLMCVGNFYDYVPIRTFASHGDIANLTRGLGVSPWLVLVVAGYPTSWAMWHFFARILPKTARLLAPGARGYQAILVVASAFLMFGYFGSSGYSGYGEVSQTLSGISILAIPGVAAVCWPSKASCAKEGDAWLRAGPTL